MTTGLWKLKRIVYLQNKIGYLNNILKKLHTPKHIGKWKSR